MKKQYKSVAEMVRDRSDEPAFADEFDERIAKRQMVKALTVLRTKAGLTQQQLAQKLGCHQSKVSKLESSNDADVRFGDLIDYMEAVGYEMRVLLVPRRQRIANEVKTHALIIKRLLGRLVQMTGKDAVMVKAAAKFLEETAFNLTQFVQDAAAELPGGEEPSNLVQVEASEVDEGGEMRETDEVPGEDELAATA